MKNLMLIIVTVLLSSTGYADWGSDYDKCSAEGREKYNACYVKVPPLWEEANNCHKKNRDKEKNCTDLAFSNGDPSKASKELTKCAKEYFDGYSTCMKDHDIPAQQAYNKCARIREEYSERCLAILEKRLETQKNTILPTQQKNTPTPARPKPIITYPYTISY